VNKLILIFILIFQFALSAQAEETYLTSEQFIKQAFHGELPKVKSVWLSAQDKKIMANIMSRKFNLLRVRYWQMSNETVWVLDEIGKEKPITIGIHIKNNQITRLKVLAYRESRGDEVRHDFFTEQFNHVELTKENMLNQHIDGITGATMSVRALTKVARLALWLNNKVQSKLAH
jgi:ACT domain-containing protein